MASGARLRSYAATAPLIGAAVAFFIPIRPCGGRACARTDDRGPPRSSSLKPHWRLWQTQAHAANGQPQVGLKPLSASPRSHRPRSSSLRLAHHGALIETASRSLPCGSSSPAIAALRFDPIRGGGLRLWRPPARFGAVGLLGVRPPALTYGWPRARTTSYAVVAPEAHQTEPWGLPARADEPDNQGHCRDAAGR